MKAIIIIIIVLLVLFWLYLLCLRCRRGKMDQAYLETAVRKRADITIQA